MNKRLQLASLFFIINTSLLFLISCTGNSKDGMVVVTETAQNFQNRNYVNGISWRFIANSRIILINPNRPKTSIKVLTDGFYSACSPQISYDGKSMLFAGQKKQEDIWQIFEMNLDNQKTKQVTHSKQNCIDPAYLTGNKFLFSQAVSIDSLKIGYALFTANLDGSDSSQITFNPQTYFASTMLKDGRILAASKEIFPKQKEAQFLVLRPDGTKGELFYKGKKGSQLQSCGWETDNAKILFIEKDSLNKNNQIVSISYSRPLHSKVILTAGIEGSFYAASPWKGDSLLVSYRSLKNNRFALYTFDSKNKTVNSLIYKNDNYNIIDAAVVKKHERPRDLPSEVNIALKTGLLLCQNINFTDSLNNPAKAVKMEVIGINKSFGTVDVEKDGSFYLHILADIPFKIKTLDANGNVVNEPSSWLYMRPGERRGCVGCHADPEQVPENRQPLAVKKASIVLPEQLDQINNKKGSLK